MTTKLKLNANFNSAFELESDANCSEGEFILQLKGKGKSFPMGVAAVAVVRVQELGTVELSMSCTKRLYKHFCEIRGLKVRKSHTQVRFEFDSVDEFQKWALKCKFQNANRHYGICSKMVCSEVPAYAKG